MKKYNYFLRTDASEAGNFLNIFSGNIQLVCVLTPAGRLTQSVNIVYILIIFSSVHFSPNLEQFSELSIQLATVHL